MFNKQPEQKKFSYKLTISVMPKWNKIIEKIGTKEEGEELFKKMKESGEKTGAMWARSYNFIEYFETTSGLIMRSQTTSLGDGTRHTYPVDEFLDYGYVFGYEYGPNKTHDQNKWSIEISDSSVCTRCFDELGNHSSIKNKDSYFVGFPLDEIVRFLVELGLRFDDTEDNTIIKWPNNIEELLKKNGFKYDTNFDEFYKPTLFKIEDHDRDFYEKSGHPQISLYGGGNPMFTSDAVDYQINFKMFRPRNNERLGWSD